MAKSASDEELRVAVIDRTVIVELSANKPIIVVQSCDVYSRRDGQCAVDHYSRLGWAACDAALRVGFAAASADRTDLADEEMDSGGGRTADRLACGLKSAAIRSSSQASYGAI